MQPDVRHPIIINSLEMKNMKKVNQLGYDHIKDRSLLRGSSKKNLNNIMCPRIWCIKCNMVITSKQFLDNDGKCYKCQGSIIQNKKIKKDTTIMIRKGGYWSDKNLPTDFIDELKSSSEFKKEFDTYFNKPENKNFINQLFFKKINKKKKFSKEECDTLILSSKNEYNDFIENEIKYQFINDPSAINLKDSEISKKYKSLWSKYLKGSEKWVIWDF